MEKNLTRRGFLGAGAILGGAALGSCLLAERSVSARAKGADWPFPYKPLPDLKAVEKRGYDSGSTGGCMFGAFDAIIGPLADKYGEPYSSFPSKMMAYGAGGIGGFRTVCGALNGAAAAFGLFVESNKARNAMIQELFLWYEKTPLPIMRVGKPVHNLPMPRSVARSTLCHISVARWCAQTGYKVKTPAHAERCHRLVGDVARKGAEILNQHASGRFAPTLALSADLVACMECHGPGTELANSISKMECDVCHGDPHPE